MLTQLSIVNHVLLTVVDRLQISCGQTAQMALPTQGVSGLPRYEFSLTVKQQEGPPATGGLPPVPHFRREIFYTNAKGFGSINSTDLGTSHP